MKTKTYNQDELKAMSPEERNALFMIATKITGTAVVRRADNSVKYDNPDLKGTYNEV